MHGAQEVRGAQAHERTVPRKVMWRLIPLLILIYMMAHLDRVNVSFAALTMNEDLGFSNQVYGLGASLFFLGYFLFEVPSNMLLERFGARRVIFVIMMIWGSVSAAMSLVWSPLSFYVMRFILGVAEAGLYPGIILYLTYWFRPQERATAVALFALALAFASLFGSPLSGVILDTMQGMGGLASWQWLFLLEGLPTLALAVFVLSYLADRPAQAKWLSREESTWLETQLSAEAAGQAGGSHDSLLAKMLNPRVLHLALVYLLFLGAFAGTLFWAPKLIAWADPELSKSAVGMLVGLPFLLFAAAMLAWGRHSDRSGERRWHVTVPALLAAAGYAVAASSSQLPVIMLGLLMSMTGAGAAFSCFWGLVTESLPRSLAAVGIAVVNSAGALGSFATVYLIGDLLERTGSYAPGFYGLAVVASLAAVVVPLLPRPVALAAVQSSG